MASVIPDPTIDLDWSGYVGSITDIFAKNATSHPDRTCVVETATSSTPERKYTYRQIFEASNILAHYLHDVGVTNGDVVMIWAHRSVDLVVAIMGTLASGATFSVLDPAYPPARQQIYLEVSQPAALVQIARATDEAGPLAPIVREYIDEELHLKGEVPSLRIDDNGHLFGGDVDGKDVFAGARANASRQPDVVIGPDSNPTLSFTSGSEGRPKGVLGRHYSLAYYFSWMAERFELSSASRYTMLSGIAHDPIQRDIFTPLFLGAQLLVPSKEDIQHEKLAEWMNKYKPTVTHLTPAMAQVLVGGASATFDSLDRAFLVGDVLTTRDCRRLRNLAENVKIVNMYGTTETQRAVSYKEIPSKKDDPNFLDTLKDTVPAGQGMKNVQLLVVNLQDRNKLCAVGETGEIYVRAAGLAEGYKGSPELNEAKFVQNWFVNNENWVESDKKSGKSEAWRKYYQGPRDRMYRTGDLGRYLENGDVECTGRADDQVKIRGFRIELNEIDSNLSQHQLIRDCKTVVQRNRNEEPTLVSYIVIELSEWPAWLEARNLDDVEDQGIEMGSVTVYLKRFRRLQGEVRDHLKTRLQIQAVPTTYIVLNKLPLNPNGKVDKPALPFPDVAEQVEDASAEDLERWENFTEMERTVASIWAKLIPGLNEKTIQPDNSFFDLGGHSLLAQQLLLQVKRQLKPDDPKWNVGIGVLYEFNTLRSFSKKVQKLLRPGHAANGSIYQIDEPSYAKSLEALLQTLPKRYQTADPATIRAKSKPTVLLTGATGFLGAYLISDILERTSRQIRLVTHVRAGDEKSGLQRLQRSLQAYGLWRDEWATRLSTVIGDLSQPLLGMKDGTWKTLAHEVDVVIHNGAMVHWVRQYKEMQASNVQSTIEAMNLCNEGKPKLFAFVSSTSVLDNDHYVKLSDQQTSTGTGAVFEEDDMMGSKTGLTTGYGQTKWVSEQLVRAAGRRGLRGSVIRPGYVLGSSEGVTNTDDFLIRMLKGSIQLSCRPKIINTVNATPVTHVARCVVASALNPLPPSEKGDAVHVIHVTGHPRLRMNEFLSPLEYYGYKVPEVSYESWKAKLEEFVSAGPVLEKDAEQHALMPLYHFCVDDLPANTRAPELDDQNAVKVLKEDAENWTGVDESAGYGISREDIGRYLSFLAEIGFVPWPSGRGRPLPDVRLSEEMRHAVGAVGGRGGAGEQKK